MGVRGKSDRDLPVQCPNGHTVIEDFLENVVHRVPSPSTSLTRRSSMSMKAHWAQPHWNGHTLTRCQSWYVLNSVTSVTETSMLKEFELDSKALSWWCVGGAMRVRPATQKKRPRCWTFTRPESDTLCGRCSSVIKSRYNRDQRE